MNEANLGPTLPPPNLSRLAPRAGSRVVVAGGCGGIGRRLVEVSVANELAVAVLDLEASIRRYPVPEGVHAFPCDATDDDSVKDAFHAIADLWQGIDHLFFLIGYTLVPPVDLAHVTLAQWDDILAGNLRSAFLVTKAAIPLLKSAGGGSIVTIASGLGVSILPGYGPYASSKAGLIALTKALAAEQAPTIRANAVAPSAILTPFMGGGASRGGDDPGTWEWFKAAAQKYVPTIPLGRLAVPDDIVGPTLFLASDAARFITGQTLHVNGGRFTP